MQYTYQIYANHIKDRHEFSNKILKDLMRKTNKIEVRDNLEIRLNNELKVKKIFYADKKVDIRIRINKLEIELLDKYYDTYLKIKNKQFEYIEFKKDNYVFNLKKIFEKISVLDIDNSIEEIVNTIFDLNIIYILKQANFLIILENIYPPNKPLKVTINLFIFLYNKIKGNFSSLFFIILLINFFILYPYNSFDLIIDKEVALAVSLALIGVVATLAGFGVVFFQLSFDNYKKNYGTYAKTLIFNSLGKEIIVIFILNIITSLLCAITKYEYEYSLFFKHSIRLQSTLLYLTIILFMYFLFLLVHKINNLLSYSLSNKDLQNTIRAIGINSLRENKIYTSNYKDVSLALKSINNNSIEIIIEVCQNYVAQGNYITSFAIIKEVRHQFQALIEKFNHNLTDITISEIATIFYRLMTRLIPSIFKSNDKDFINQFITNLQDFNLFFSTQNGNTVSFEEMMYTINQIINLSLTNRDDKYSFTTLQCYQTSLFSQIFYSTPPWYNIQTGSISIGRERGYIFSVNKQYIDSLWYYSVSELFQHISSYIDNNSSLNLNEKYNFINIYKTFMEKNIVFNHSYKLRYHYINELSSKNCNLCMNAFEKIDFNNFTFNSYDDNIGFYSPINPVLLCFIIIHEKPIISELLLRNYIIWCKFIISSYKSDKFISEVVSESLFVLRKLLLYIVQLKNLPERDQSTDLTIQNITNSITMIIDFYYNFNFSNDEKFRDVISEINSIFWNFKEFEMKEFDITDNLLIDKFNQIVFKTVWANTR